MIDFESNKSITEFTTFGVPVIAKYFTQFSDNETLKEILTHTKFLKENKLILGGGSNILFTKDFDGIVMKNNFSGISVLKETNESILVKCGAGVNWHEFVMYCVNNGYAGIENLALIPGNVGTSPMQNIGAYGVEMKDVFHSLEAINIESFEEVTFDKAACKFGYRESVFKNIYKNKFVITSVTFQLSITPVFNISYGAIEKELEAMDIKTLSIKAISEAVIRIRSSKLPDPKNIGNAGSFFKNPVIENSKFLKLKEKYPEIASYPQPDGKVKIAAGWLIDKLGWKGKTFGDYGVHKNQALVLVNYGESSGKDIYNLSSEILDSVKEEFDITLEREVNIL